MRVIDFYDGQYDPSDYDCESDDPFYDITLGHRNYDVPTDDKGYPDFESEGYY